MKLTYGNITKGKKLYLCLIKQHTIKTFLYSPKNEEVWRLEV